jgi:hypothetical protein
MSGQVMPGRDKLSHIRSRYVRLGLVNSCYVRLGQVRPDKSNYNRLRQVRSGRTG